MNLHTIDCRTEETIDPLDLCCLDQDGKLQLTDKLRAEIATKWKGLGEPDAWELHQTWGKYVLYVRFNWGTYHPERWINLTHVPEAWKHLVHYRNSEEKTRIMSTPGDAVHQP